MGGAFHERLSQLRKSRRNSQRAVAADLYISQALLSHYENGIREPGLDFVCRACDYYGVSADYLLGRVADSPPRPASTAEGGAHEPPMDLKAITSLFQAVAQLDNRKLSHGVRRCFGALSYRILRHMAAFETGGEPQQALIIEERRVGPLSDLEMRLAEIQVQEALEAVLGGEPPEGEALSLPQDLAALLRRLDEEIA